MGDDKIATLMEEMRVLAGVQLGGVLSLMEAATPAKVRHARDRTKSVVTPPIRVLYSILGGGGKKVEADSDLIATLDVGAPNLLTLQAYFSTQHGGSGYVTSGDYHSIILMALNPATNKEDQIKRFIIPSDVYFKGHTKSWWIGGREGGPSCQDPDMVEKAIDKTVADARKFVAKYVKAAKGSAPKGSAGLLAQAQEINQRLNLRIPNSALKKLCAELKS